MDHRCGNPQEGWAVDQKEINNSRAWPAITGKSKDTEETNVSWPNAEIKCTLTCFLGQRFTALYDLVWGQVPVLKSEHRAEHTGWGYNLHTGPAWLKPPGQGTTETKREGSGEEGNTGTSRVCAAWWVRQFSDLVQTFTSVSCVAGINPSTAGLGLLDGSLQLEAPGQESVQSRDSAVAFCKWILSWVGWGVIKRYCKDGYGGSPYCY